MENKKVLFITYDLSGYYNSVYDELASRYSDVTFYNSATARYKYKNLLEKIHSFFYRIFTGKKLKNFYKYNDFITEAGKNKYDITLVVRPDLFFDSQLETLRKSSTRFIAYYHDSVNNLNRKKDVIHYFDKVYSYEKKDCRDFKLTFLSNFIYFAPESFSDTANTDVFSVTSIDYRLPVLLKLAEFLKRQNISYRFFVLDNKNRKNDLVNIITTRMSNAEVISEIENARIIADIHKFGVQDGLTFRVFESIGLCKKLITTNQDIKIYDFYDSQNIFVLENLHDINIPVEFFKSPYKNLPQHIVEKYTVQSWLDRILS